MLASLVSDPIRNEFSFVSDRPPSSHDRKSNYSFSELANYLALLLSIKDEHRGAAKGILCEKLGDSLVPAVTFTHHQPKIETKSAVRTRT
jgi:hypothetical protein